MHAFRCKNCGHLHAAEHAGENAKPSACVICGFGVKFSPKGVKSLDPDNWEVLAEADDARLAELGVERAHAVRHVSNMDTVAVGNLQRSEEAKAILLEKQKLWKSKPVAEWQKELDALYAKADALAAKVVSDADHGDHEHAKAAVTQAIADLKAKEWTSRDDKHLAELQEAIDNQGYRAGHAPKSVLVSAREGTTARQSTLAHKS